jgi:cytoskeletal protein CcmA (bactofilin family)
MFSKPGSKGEKTAAVYAEKVSIIAAGLKLKGDMEADGDIRIDGEIIGNVLCKAKVVISATGLVSGDIHAENVDVHGTVQGNITVGELLSIKAKSHITGNLITEKLQIEANAVFNGLCTMTIDPAGSISSKETLRFQEN